MLKLCSEIDEQKSWIVQFALQVVEEQMGRRGEAVHPLRPMLHCTLADVQERLTFQAQAFIKVLTTALVLLRVTSTQQPEPMLCHQSSLELTVQQQLC